MKLKNFALALVALIATASLAAFAQTWPNLPSVGGASYCGGFSSGPTGQVCTVTVPAGPTGMTGAETIPGDTNLARGAQPQTVKIPSLLLGGGAIQYVVPTNASTTAVSASTGKLIMNPAGTLTTVTITLPAATALIDGQTLEFSSTQTLTGVTITEGSGTTMTNKPTALTVSTTAAYGYKFIYRAATTNWYRLQ